MKSDVLNESSNTTTTTSATTASTINESNNTTTTATTTPNQSTHKKITPHFIDLRKDYDYKVLKRFYEELMVPNFPKEDELEPLDNWVEMFQENLSFNDSTLLFDPLQQQTTTLNLDQRSDLNYLGCEIDFHIILALCPPDEKKNKDQSDIMGGVVFEFYPTINCGCITYLLVSSEYRGQGLAGTLLKEATERLMENGRIRGHLGGCNAIFLETNSSEKVTPEEDVMDPAKRHTIFHKLGIKLLDFDYIQPPLSKEGGKCKDLLLTCLVTPNIPKYTLGKEERYYLPSTLLKNFLRVFWDSCCSRLDSKNWEMDIDYQRMMDQVNRRDRIPLLDLPWERPWSLVDLRDTFDSTPLIEKFYNQVLAPNFSGSDELEPLESWMNMLPSQSSNSNSSSEDFHLLVALRYPDQDPEDDDEDSQPIICGGLAFEYHKSVNCGLLTYLLVGGGQNNRGERMARALLQRAVDILEQNAVDCGHLAGCNAIFLETSYQNHSSSSYSNNHQIFEESSEITEISYKQEFLELMGWRKVDFQYIQPPLSYDKQPSKSLNLIVLVTPRIPQERIQNQQQNDELCYLPNTLLINFISTFWRNTCSRTGYWFEDDIDYKKMMDSLTRREKIPLLKMPWQRPFIFLDLGVNFHEDLFNSFYNSLPTSEDIQSKSTLLSSLLNSQSQIKSTGRLCQKKEEDLHILLALTYQQSDDSIIPIIIGSVIFSYFLNSNCGLISNILIKNNSNNSNNSNNNNNNNEDGSSSPKKQSNGHCDAISLYKGWDIGKELLNQSVEILNRNARAKTHISGPNAIFLENSISIIPNYHFTISNLNANINRYNIMKQLQQQHQQQQQQQHNEFIPLPYSFEIQKLGWLLLDLEYYSPPKLDTLKTGKASLLSVLFTPQLPKLSVDHPLGLLHTSNGSGSGIKNGKTLPTKLSISSTISLNSGGTGTSNTSNGTYGNNGNGLSSSYLPKDLLRSFLMVYWLSIFNRNNLDHSLILQDPTYQKMIEQIKSKEKILLLELNDSKL